MDNAYITLENLDRFRKNLRRSTAGQGTGARVLHNRMISYYSQPGEVYSVVKRMRIPRVKAGDSFCLKGIIPDGCTLDSKSFRSQTGALGLSLRQLIKTAAQEYYEPNELIFDDETQTLTVLKEFESDGSPATVLIPTKFFGMRGRITGCINRKGKLIQMKADCARPLAARSLNDLYQSIATTSVLHLYKRGYEVQQLRRYYNYTLSIWALTDEDRKELLKMHDGSYSSMVPEKMIEKMLEHTGLSSLDEIDHLPGNDRRLETLPYKRYLNFILSGRYRHLKLKWRKLGRGYFRSERLVSHYPKFYRIRRKRGESATEWRMYEVRCPMSRDTPLTGGDILGDGSSPVIIKEIAELPGWVTQWAGV